MKYSTPRHHSYNRQRTGKRFAFNRSLLPDPIEYLKANQYTPKGKGLWRDMVCPFHNDSSPSLRINSVQGSFKCMACGAKGGDILAFHMQATGKPFIEACKDLGAWEVEA